MNSEFYRNMNTIINKDLNEIKNMNFNYRNVYLNYNFNNDNFQKYYTVGFNELKDILLFYLIEKNYIKLEDHYYIMKYIFKYLNENKKLILSDFLNSTKNIIQNQDLVIQTLEYLISEEKLLLFYEQNKEIYTLSFDTMDIEYRNLIIRKNKKIKDIFEVNILESLIINNYKNLNEKTGYNFKYFENKILNVVLNFDFNNYINKFKNNNFYNFNEFMNYFKKNNLFFKSEFDHGKLIFLI
jgi:hypothetical protein